ncbi:MAG: hypothetical protein SGILL_007281 [Bacillariaceae sp.]
MQKQQSTRLNVMDRREALAFAGAAILFPAAANAEAFIKANEPSDYEIVKEQRQTTDKLDINNAPVADYMQFPGMYPNLAGKIANNGPYKNVGEISKKLNLSSGEKATLKKYEAKMTATEATGLDPMRGRDPYRRAFMDSTEVGAAPLRK